MSMLNEVMTLSIPSLNELLRKGQALMIPLILLNFLSWTIILDRTFYWILTFIRQRRERRLLEIFFRTDRNVSLRAYLEQTLGSPGREPDLSTSLYMNTLLAREEKPDKESDWEEETEAVLGRSERFLSFLTLVATLGTSFGLLGTVLGVSKSLQFIESDFSATVSGLSVALYTTIGGLVVSIISLTAYGIFTSLSDSLGRSMQHQVQRLVKRLDAKAAPSPLSPKPPSPRPSPSSLTLGSMAAPLAPPPPKGLERREDTLAITPRDLSSGDIVIEDLSDEGRF